MDTELAKKFAKDWIDAWNSHDLRAIMEHYDENINFQSPFIEKLGINDDGRIHDKNTLHYYFGVALKKYPDLQFELISCLYGMNSVVLYYKSINALVSAEYMEINIHGKVSRVVAHYSSV